MDGQRDTGRMQAGTDIISSILYVNGGTLLFQLPPIKGDGKPIKSDLATSPFTTFLLNLGTSLKHTPS